MNTIGFGRKNLMPDYDTIPIVCLEGVKKTTKEVSQNIPADIQKEYLPKTSLHLY
jgi:hypothetical protein